MTNSNLPDKENSLSERLEAIRALIHQKGTSSVSKDDRLLVLPPGSRISGTSGKTFVNWVIIRNDFCMGSAFTDPVSKMSYIKYPELKELAYKYGINLNTLYQKSSRENWSLMRDSFSTKFQETLDTTNINSFISSSAEYDARTLEAVKKVFRLIEVYLRKFGDDIFEEDEGVVVFTPENLPPDIILSIKDIDGLLTVLQKAHSMVRTIVGDSESANTVKNLMDEIKTTKRNSKQEESIDIGKIIDKQLLTRKALQDQINMLRGQSETSEVE